MRSRLNFGVTARHLQRGVSELDGKHKLPSLYLEAVCLAIGIFVVLAFLLWIQVNTWLFWKGKAAAERDAAASASAYLAHLQDVKRQSGEITQQVVKLERSVPGDPAEGYLVAELQVLSQKNLVDFLGISFKDTVSRGKYSEIPFTANIQGSYPGIAGFIEDLQTAERPARVEGVKFTQVEDEKSGFVKAEIEAAVFFKNAMGGS